MNDSKEEIELTIEDVVYQGKGLARLDGKVVFVPGVLPDEVVKVRIARHGKNFSEAQLMEVVKASPARIKPTCSLVMHAGQRLNAACPGCVYQHIEYSTEVALKQKQFVNLMQRMAGVDPSVCQAAVPAPRAMGYRNKIVLHGSVTNNVPALGYYKDDNTTVLDVPSCPLARPEINELLNKTRSDIKFANNVNDHTTATFRYTEKDGAVMWLGQRCDSESWLTEATVLGDVKVPRGSFFQVNNAVADLVLAYVIGLIKQVNPASVIDMYCGVGMFAFAAVKAGVKDVSAVEMDTHAMITAARNATKLGIEEGLEFKATTAQKGLKWALAKTEPGKTTVIIDPPRKGLEKEIVQRLVTAKPAGIIYISCAADTMARDVKQLKAAGYAVRSARMFDMFPRTPYFESVTWLVQQKEKEA